MGVVCSGGKVSLPYQWNHKDYELQLRPLVKDSYVHDWSLVTRKENHGYSLKSLEDGLDLISEKF